MPANFVWYEFHTPDARVAESFYGKVLQWGMRDAGMPDLRYTLFAVDGIEIGGLLEKPVESFTKGSRPGWMGYIGVADVHASLAKLQKLGGVIHRAAEDIPNVGRFAVVADPQGANFVLFQPPDSRQQPPRPKAGSPGSAAWHDLTASDWEADFAFYADMFGWSKANAVDMGPNGVYQIFASGVEQVGGMMTRMDPSQNPGWLFYFYIENIEAAIGRVKQNGGSVVHGPSVVPGGQQIAHCLDPQGGIFGICTPRI